MGSSRDRLSRLDIVCDAGPLIHLDELDCLDLFSTFRTVMVPDQVWTEVNHHRPAALTFSALQRVPVKISEEPRFQVLVRTFLLDKGEQAALSLMVSQPAAVFLTDDGAARLAAKTLGYRTYGSIGVLIRAIRNGLRTRTEVCSILRSIPFRSTLHIRRSWLQEILLELEGEDGEGVPGN